MDAESSFRGRRCPVIMREGFRVFFLVAAGWAALALLLYMLQLSGVVVMAPAFSVVDWHIHEFLFGYAGAVIAGFALTVVPTWSRRPPLGGPRLLALVVLWLAGRFAMTWGAGLGASAVAAIDLAFPLVLMLLVGRSLPALALIGLFLLANAGFHHEVAAAGVADHAARAGIAVILTLMILVGGRIIPAFTREWMTAHGDPALPSDFDVFDGVTIAVSALGLGLWSMAPYAPTSALVLAFAGLLNFARLARWHGSHVRTEGLLAVLHIAYAFIPVGLLAMALSAFDPLLMPPSAAMHLLTIGAITMMTLAVMTRISLDYTGRPLHADRVILAIFIAMTLSLLARFAYALQPGYTLLLASAALWIVTFLVFLWRFGFLARSRF
ncbi:MAG: NnrS family protein [Oricola sp.]